MFSTPDTYHKPDDNIDWIADLKFFIDNNEKLLEKYLFPVVRKHMKNIDDRHAWSWYIPCVKRCLAAYCSGYNITDCHEKFPKSAIVELAKTIASEQEQHIKQGQYNAFK